MELDKTKIVNKYHLCQTQFESIIDIINFYLRKIELENFKSQTYTEQIGVLGVIAETIPIMSKKDEALKTGKYLVYKLLLKIKNGEIPSLALHEGLSNIGLFIYTLNNETSLFLAELNWINKIICKVLENKLQYLKGTASVRTAEFDTITGLSGIGNYLLLFFGDLHINAILKRICEYLVNMVVLPSKSHVFPAWAIDLQNEPLRKYYSAYDSGYINYTVSHGCGGILLFLIHAYNTGVKVNRQKEAIGIITKEYLHINKWSNGIWWAGIISKHDYERKSFPNVVQRQSWCSGNISSLYAVYKASQLLKNQDIEMKAYQEIRRIIELSFEKYGLYSPIICHGYAGLLTILRNFNEEANNDIVYVKMILLLTKLIDSFNKNSKYGFENKKFPNSKIEVLKEDNTFLNGAAGIIIELVSWLKKSSSFEKLLMLE